MDEPSTPRASRVDCVVIGAGPAGLTAALYLTRFLRRVALFDDGGSRARQIPLSHNYPGFPSGIGGAELLQRLGDQLLLAGGAIREERVTQLAATRGGFAVKTAATSLIARTALIATGTRDLEPVIEGLDRIRDAGLMRQCPICDGFEFARRRIVVVGVGAHGVREARFLTGYSDSVTYVEAGGVPECEPEDDLLEVVRGRPHSVRQADRGLVLTLTDGTHVPCDVLYSAMGSVPASALARSLGAATDGQGNLVVDHHCRTSVPGLWAAGDVVAGLDQLAVAIGQAAIAATSIHNALRGASAGLVPDAAADPARDRAS